MMMQTRTLTLALVAGVTMSTAATAQTALPARPEKIEFKPLKFDPPKASDYRKVLPKSGVPVYLAPSNELPLVQITMVFKGGEYLAPAEKAGLAEATGAMIRRGGTASMKAQEVDEKFDFLAAIATTSSGGTTSSASLNSLKSNLAESFALFADMLKNPGFQDDKWEIWKGEKIEQMKQRNDDANSIAAREWPGILFGRDHFEGREMTKPTLDAITTSDMREFAKRVFNPGNVIVGVSGDFDPAQIIEMLDKAFEGWAKGEKQPDPPAPTHKIAPGVYRIEKDIPQGKVDIGLRGLKRDDPDFFAVQVMNDILGGGGFTSRIMSRVRSDEGLAYGAGSRFSFPVYYPGQFSATFASKNRTVALATKIIFEEFEKIKTTPVSDEEMKTAKATFIETFPRTFESRQAMLGVFISDEWTNRDPNYWQTYRDNINKVTKEDVQRVAKKYLTPENMAVLVVGKWSEIAPGDLEGRAKMAEFFGGKSTEMPLRDPLTLQPMAGK